MTPADSSGDDDDDDLEIIFVVPASKPSSIGMFSEGNPEMK
jgi:hypothetical protein